MVQFPATFTSLIEKEMGEKRRERERGHQIALETIRITNDHFLRLVVSIHSGWTVRNRERERKKKNKREQKKKNRKIKRGWKTE